MGLFFSAVQWLFFILASSLVAPIAIAGLFHLSPADTAEFVQRTMFVLGLSGIIQALIGHRLPINEGPAGLWWGVFAIYAGFAGTIYSSTEQALQSLEGGMIVSGVIFIFLAAFGLLEKMAKLFTPTVTFIYLLLLILQLSGSFLNGMFGLPNEAGTVRPLIMAGSAMTLIAAFYFSAHHVHWIRQYSVIISLGFGWLLFLLIGEAPLMSASDKQLFSLPGLFVFGPPLFDSGTIVTAAFITLLLTANMIASVRVMEEVMTHLNSSIQKGSYRSAGLAAGLNQMLGGSFSAIGSVPISGAAGFVAQTGNASIRPFFVGSLLVVGMSIFPPVMNILASLPAPVGYAVTFVIFARMAGFAFAEMDKEKNKERVRLVAGISLLAGVGAMFVPAAAFTNFPAAAASILNNGLILGTIISICVEQFLLAMTKQKAHN
ncbi:purine/pyrimidine permease [Pseudobacillus wudalianchiensis]|uniref:Purine permease n=1 Tax=Pseudobacillus wudalianchiensis TaxID=1743143 RepID=A0A1B9B798_9BACI|nr:purine/pyrimidine permease [Bacillus wudalianchiensis]OCA91974.1 purine permease [Bacillus wudalianchiensis]